MPACWKWIYISVLEAGALEDCEFESRRRYLTIPSWISEANMGYSLTLSQLETSIGVAQLEYCNGFLPHRLEVQILSPIFQASVTQ